MRDGGRPSRDRQDAGGGSQRVRGATSGRDGRRGGFVGVVCGKVGGKAPLPSEIAFKLLALRGRETLRRVDDLAYSAVEIIRPVDVAENLAERRRKSGIGRRARACAISPSGRARRTCIHAGEVEAGGNSSCPYDVGGVGVDDVDLVRVVPKFRAADVVVVVAAAEYCARTCRPSCDTHGRNAGGPQHTWRADWPLRWRGSDCQRGRALAWS